MQLESYNAIIISDAGTCDPAGLSFLNDPIVSANLAAAATGLVFITGTSLTLNYNEVVSDSTTAADILELIGDALYWVSYGPSTGLYLSLSCYYEDDFPHVPVPALAGFGGFIAGNPDDLPAGCSSDAVFVDQGGALPGFTSARLNGFPCPVAEVFSTVPSDGGWQIAATGGMNALPYILTRRQTESRCGNFRIDLAWGEQCDDGPAGSEICSDTCLCLHGITEGVCNPAPGTTTTDTSTTATTTATDTTDTDTTTATDTTATDTTTATGTTATDTTATDTTATDTTATDTTDTNTSEPTATDTGSTDSTTATDTSPTSEPTSTDTHSTTLEPTSTTSDISNTSVTTSSSATSTVTSNPYPEFLSLFRFVGCANSLQHFPSFSLQISSDVLDLETCIAACSQHLYAGAHGRYVYFPFRHSPFIISPPMPSPMIQLPHSPPLPPQVVPKKIHRSSTNLNASDCYCSDKQEPLVTVDVGVCNRPCPGNRFEFCGGDLTSPARLGRRQSPPDTALLAIYINTAAIVPTTTVTVTNIATDTVTSTTAGPIVPVPVGPYGNFWGYIFVLIVGIPDDGEIVFVLAPCDGPGGWGYEPADCRGHECQGQAVYRAVPCSSDTVDSGVVVYKPQSCDCAGGVTFVQAVGNSGGGLTSTVVVKSTPAAAPPVTGGGAGSPSVASTSPGVVSTSPAVVTAGTSKMAGSWTSLVMVVAVAALFAQA